MNRRDLIKNIALISGGVFIGSEFLLTSCKNTLAGNLKLDKSNIQLLSEISETIVPETNSPGAQSTQVANFITKVFNDIYTEEEQKEFLNTLSMINNWAKDNKSNEFSKLPSEDKLKAINEIKDPKDKGFLALYQIVLYGYLTSEKGLQSNFRYTPVPGKFIGDIPYKKGDKMFAGLGL